MDLKVKMKKGGFYRNELWFSPAYQHLNNSSRDLLQCLYTEINKVKVKGKWEDFRNGELSFVESDYRRLTGRCKQTYLTARNQLIEVGFIKMTHRGGGGGRGDRAMYRVLFCNDVLIKHQRWRRYPDENDSPPSYRHPYNSPASPCSRHWWQNRPMLCTAPPEYSAQRKAHS